MIANCLSLLCKSAILRAIPCILLLLSGASASEPSGWAEFLDRYLVQKAPGVTAIRYGAVSRDDHRALELHIAELAAAGPPDDRDAAFAYWANLYNALTVDLVLDHYPVDSIRDIRFGLALRPGPWRKDLVTVGDRALSLDDIEHGILRKDWSEPRVHFAVNCAAVGCPALRPEPFDGDRLDAQLETAAHDFINSDRAVRIDGTGVTLSSIFDWYGKDFASSDAAILDYVTRYAEPALAERLDGIRDIDGYAYDWALNDAGR